MWIRPRNQLWYSSELSRYKINTSVLKSFNASIIIFFYAQQKKTPIQPIPYDKWTCFYSLFLSLSLLHKQPKTVVAKSRAVHIDFYYLRLCQYKIDKSDYGGNKYHRCHWIKSLKLFNRTGSQNLMHWQCSS